VLVRVKACGICGSDVHGYDGSSGRRIPPLVMGHEAAGVIERTGARVDGFRAGDRVTFDSTVSCGACDFCRRGQINLCDNRRVLGVSCAEYRRHGAFAEYVAVPSRIVYRLPDGMPFEHAAVIEAVSVAVHAVGRRTPSPDERVLVIGCGMIGLLVIQVLRARGCRSVSAFDIDAERLALAERFGASAAAGAGTFDAVYECVGRAETVAKAIRSVRKGGTVTLVGNLAPSVPLPLQEVVTRELSLLGTCASSGEYPECIELMASGAIDVAPLISAKAPLEEGPAWFDRLYQGGGRLMKVVLQP
jgi:L-iditol 2-dehydrogenase